MNEKVMVSPEIQSEAVVLPQIVSIKQASQRMGLPEYYIRRLCRAVLLSFQRLRAPLQACQAFLVV